MNAGAIRAQAADGQAESDVAARPPPASVEEEIVVVAAPNERASIDATTYLVRDNAEARSSNILDLMARIPSIKVLPGGQVLLMSRSDVRILIDGREVAAPAELLRNMQGSQVARIEVVTNPSARFSAQGTAGVINIITRRSFGSGLGGSVTGKAGSFGTYDFKASPTWSRDKLSVAGGLGLSRSPDRVDVERDRRRIGEDGSASTELIERGTIRTNGRTVAGNARIGYQLAPKQNLSLTAVAVETNARTSRRFELEQFGEEAEAFLLTGSGGSSSSLWDFAGDYRREGKRPGEMLTLSVRRSTSASRGENEFSVVNPGRQSQLKFRSEASTRITGLNLDFVRPLKAGRRLLMGGSLQRRAERNLFRQEGEPNYRDEPISILAQVQGSWVEKAFYASFQSPLLGGTVLAGMRIEDRRFDLADEDIPSVAGGTNLFPSLHVEREIAKGVRASASYSRRISWPSILELSPALRLIDPTTATRGNPLLRPETTDSFEFKLAAQVLKQSVDITAYTRRTKNLGSPSSELEDGILVQRPINLGTRDSRGVSMSIRGNLAKRFRYLLNGDIIDDRIDFPDADSFFLASGARASASAQLEYIDGVEGRRHSDRVELRLRYDGGTEQGLFRISPYFDAHASWSHGFTDRLAGVLTISDPFGPPTIESTYFSPGSVSVQRDRRRGPRFFLSLTRLLGPLPKR